MNFFELVKYRRSLRRYQNRQIGRGDLEKIIEAGLYAPSAGGGQRTMIVALRNRELSENIGKLNIAGFRRDNLAGSYVSSEQPSIIDDPAISSGFYGAPSGRKIFCTARRMHSAVPKIWCWRQPSWDSHPVSSHGERKLSAVKKERSF